VLCHVVSVTEDISVLPAGSWQLAETKGDA